MKCFSRNDRRVLITALLLLVLSTTGAFTQPLSLPPEEQFQIIRPLGWSSDGKFAFMRNSVVDPWCDTCIPDQIVIVQDLVTDEIVYERSIRNGLFDGIGFEGWWTENVEVLADELAAFGVDMGRPGSAFPGNTFSAAGWHYTVAIQSSAEERAVESFAGPPAPTAVLRDPIVVIEAQNRAGTNRSWKTIHRGPEFPGDDGGATSARIAGVIVDPSGRRSAVVYAWRAAGLDAGDDLTVIGAHLSAGYQSGTPAPPEGFVQSASIEARSILAERVRSRHTNIDRILEVARDVVRAITTKDSGGLSRYVDPETGFYTLTNPGVMIQMDHHIALPQSLLVGVPPTEDEIDAAVTPDRVAFIDGIDTLSSLVQWQIEPETYDLDRIAGVESSTSIVVSPRLGVVQKLYFTEIGDTIYLTVADLVTPGDA
jgi:hypothetical protein